ncbi:MAG TPA: carboxypeptidase-like regulatory domain-containing protein [bacterium]|nr:carboxypeptidase-like regulatory domain-containing protein [bacterium]
MNRRGTGRFTLTISIVLIALAIVATAADVWAAGVGKVSGLVVDKKTKEPLIGCPVQIEGTTLGALTDVDGRYTILSVPLGLVSVGARMVGYTPMIVSDVTVKPDQTSVVNFELEESEVQLEAVVVRGRAEMIQMDQATTKRDVTAEKIKTLPVTNVGDILKTQVGVTVRNDRFHIRGGRSTELVYAVDGVTLSDPLGGRGATAALNLSGTEIENISIVKGAWSPEYGGTSGIVNVATKEGDPQVTRGHLQYFTDDFGTSALNTYSRNFQRMEFTLGGPDPIFTNRLLPALGINGAQEKLTYFISLDFDRSDGAFDWDRYTSPTRPARYRDIKFLGMVFSERQNNSGNALLKLTYRLTPDIRVTGQYKKTYERNQQWSWAYRYTPNSQDWIEDENDFYSVRWVHNLGPSTYYEVLYSDFVRNYWEKPGDPNKPGGTMSPDDFLFDFQADKFLDVNGNGVWDAPEQWIEIYPDGQYNFGDIFEDRDGNGIFDPQQTPADTTYDSLIFDFNGNGTYDFSSGEPYLDANKNGVYDEGDLLTQDGNGNGTYDPDRELNRFDGESTSPNDNPEPFVDGDVSKGEPFVDVNRNGVWDGPGVLPGYPLGEPFTDLSHDGKRQSSEDPWVPGIPFEDLNGNGSYDPGAASPSGSWSNLDENYDIGEPYLDVNGDGERDRRDGYYDLGWDRSATWHERKPRTRTIKADLVSQMRREHEVKMGLSYSAFDLIYNELQQPYVPYTLGFDGGPFPFRGAIRNFYHQTPKTGAVYLVDKMEYGQMVAQVGFRYEYFVQSSNAETTDTARADSVGVEDYRDKFAPRLAFSYPISDKAKVFFNYGHFYQLPQMHFMYRRNTQLGNVSGTIGNVNLDFVKTIKYEFGVQYLLSPEYLLSVQGFYSDDFARVSESEAQGQTTLEEQNYYENSDYSRTRGLEVELDKKYGNYVSGSMTYNFSYAYGKSSAEALDYFDNFYARSGGRFVIQEFPLDWDERHKVTFILDLRVPANDHPKLFGLTLPDNFGLNIFWQYGSGFPYTPTKDHPGIASQLAPGQEPLANSERYPATSNVDIRFNKDFKIGPMDYTIELWVNNLFDNRDVVAVYSATGRPESGLVNESVVLESNGEPSPTNWTARRQIRLGLGVNF